VRFENPGDDEIRTLLAEPRTFAVVGLSDNPARPSNEVAAYLLRQGFTITPVNPTLKEVFGIPCHAGLGTVPRPVDVVDVFRRPEHVPAIVEEAIEVRARALWMQLGVVHEQAALRAREAGLLVVMDRCPAIEFRRLFREE